MNTFAQRIKELREDKGMSQKALATVLSLKQQSISMWESGIREPNFDMVINICKFFDCTADYLLGLSDY